MNNDDVVDNNDDAIVLFVGNVNNAEVDEHCDCDDDDDELDGGNDDDDEGWVRHKRAQMDAIVVIDLISNDIRKDLEYECHMVRKLLVFIDACVNW